MQTKCAKTDSEIMLKMCYTFPNKQKKGQHNGIECCCCKLKPGDGAPDSATIKEIQH